MLGLLAAAGVGPCPDALAEPAQPVTEERLERLVDDSLDGLMGRQLPWGGFDDPLSGASFNYGAVALAWLAGDRAGAGPAGDERRRAAAVTLRSATRVAAPGAFQMWIEALALQPAAGWLDAGTRAALSDHLARFAVASVGPRARRCATDPRCYNNLKLVDTVGTLEQVRTGVRSPVPRTRLADPEAAERLARNFLATALTRAQKANVRLRAGSLAISDAAVLSDPSRNPLAYHALSSAMLMRAVRLLGAEAPAAARAAARRALWALVALADPRGEVTWMGRGQQLSWPVGATLYAAVAGAAEFAVLDPPLAGRLRRLAQLALAELTRRSGAVGLTRGLGRARRSPGSTTAPTRSPATASPSRSCTWPPPRRPARRARRRRCPPSSRGRRPSIPTRPALPRCAARAPGWRSTARRRIRVTLATTSGCSPHWSGPAAAGSPSSGSARTRIAVAARRRPGRCWWWALMSSRPPGGFSHATAG